MEKVRIYKKPLRCPHDKIKAVCKDCKGCAICVHGRRKTICKECGGGSLCEHGRERIKCKLCGGNSVCEHKRIKSACKECGGSEICQHNRNKHNCRECGGKAFCEHDKRKTECNECKGGGICGHMRRRYDCKECDGTAFCQHNKRKAQCKDCGGSQICEHKKNKSICKECNQNGVVTNLCQHGKRKARCKQCGGSEICEHNKYKSSCKECGGTRFCEHNKQKPYCKICGGSALCKSVWCETYASKKYNGYCLHCCIQLCPDIKVSRNYKTKEKEVVDRIKEAFPNLTWITDKKIQDGCSSKRPDLLVDLGTHIVIMEVDENKHTNYDCSCENKRLMELSQDVGHRPIVFIRFNPDSYIDGTGKKIKSCWKLNKLGIMCIEKTNQKLWNERINILLQQIKYWIDNPSEKTIEIIELFY